MIHVIQPIKYLICSIETLKDKIRPTLKSTFVEAKHLHDCNSREKNRGIRCYVNKSTYLHVVRKQFLKTPVKGFPFYSSFLSSEKKKTLFWTIQSFCFAAGNSKRRTFKAFHTELEHKENR